MPALKRHRSRNEPKQKQKFGNVLNSHLIAQW